MLLHRFRYAHAWGGLMCKIHVNVDQKLSVGVTLYEFEWRPK